MSLLKAKQTDIADLTTAILAFIGSNSIQKNTFSNLVNSVNTFVTIPTNHGPVLDIVISTITGTSALVSWTAISGAISYTVEYFIKGDELETTLISDILTNNVTLTGLTAGTTYVVKVRPLF